MNVPQPRIRPMMDMNIDPTCVLNGLTLDRIDPDTIEISWKAPCAAAGIAVYRFDKPAANGTGRPVARVSEGKRVRLRSVFVEKREFFRVVPDKGNGRMVAERHVPLENTFNFRDLGGYDTVDGRRTRWGLAYRADNLSRLTEAGLRSLQHMDIRRVYDLRSIGEAQARPDRLPQDPGVRYVHLPVVQGELDGVAVFERIRQGDTSWFTDGFMLDGYVRGIEDFADVWGRIIRELADDDSGAMVFHCSAGKDRTGIAAALILLSLGVPEETVIHDHQLSNIHIAPAMEDLYSRIRSFGVDPEPIAPYFAAPLECIQGMMAHLRTAYGSAVDYLTDRAGVPHGTLERLRSRMLE